MTNNSIQQFNFNSNEVRVLADEQDEPWFVTKDVCDILGIRTDNAKTTLDKDEIAELSNRYTLGVGVIPTIISHSNGGRAPLIVSEAGKYKLIIRSRKDSAKPFQRWVTHEVLPSICKHGGCMSG